MRLFPIFCALCLTGCSAPARVETRLVVPDVPAELRHPCTAPARPYESLRDVGLILTDHVEALDCANGKIVAIDTILTKAEAQAAAGD